ncbi:MAG TPA: DUF3817 domain-containing protein [Caulifigura sp.]|jgi:integral membrane protein|nr:DUF3817 domain-containing protein [Caulifigura sp.]
MRTSTTGLRIVGTLEGLSFLLLLGVAMPLKYFSGMPLAVRLAGTLHGALFVLYVIAVIRTARANRWPFERIFEAITASLYPLGTFLLNRRLREEEKTPATRALQPQLSRSSSHDAREAVH